jgi:hypothetical protein
MREQGYNVSELCEATGVSRPGYYAWRGRPPGDRDSGNAEIAGRIREIHTQRFKGAYGSPRLTGDLRGMGYGCSENRVARIMRKEGIRAKFKSPFRPKTTCADASAKFSPNALKYRRAQGLPAELTHAPGREAAHWHRL